MKLDTGNVNTDLTCLTARHSPDATLVKSEHMRAPVLPFNVNGVDKEKIKGDSRYCFGLPNTDNANYLWIQEFYSALNEHGRAGFVMANSASDARNSEMEIRRKLIQAHAVDVMVSIGSNFFYTVTLPCKIGRASCRERV